MVHSSYTSGALASDRDVLVRTTPMPDYVQTPASFSRQFLSRTDDGAQLTDTFETWVDDCGGQARTAHDLSLMLDESIANAIMHTHARREDGRIEVRFDGRAVGVTLRDYGSAFDPTRLAIADIDKDLDAREICGLGGRCARRPTDCLDYRCNRGANEITFSKTDLAPAATNGGVSVSG